MSRSTKRTSQKEVETILAKLRACGLPTASFARCTGLKASTIYRWQREARARAKKSPGAQAFTPVKVVNEVVAATPELVVEIGPTVRLRLQPDFDSESVARLLRLVQQC